MPNGLTAAETSRRRLWGTATLLLIGAMFLGPYLWMRLRDEEDGRVALMIALGCLAAAVATAGFAVTGSVWGVFIDSRNRISLSRFQAILWTVVILGGFGAVVISRIVVGELDALNIAVPQELRWLMGISAASMVTSPVLKQAARQREDIAARESAIRVADAHGIDSASVRVEGSVVVNRTRQQAVWTDMIEGEQSTDFKSVDIGKLQMLVITAVTVLAYFSALLSSFEHAGNSPIGGLPVITQSLNVLLGISHTGYLAAKSIPKRGT